MDREEYDWLAGMIDLMGESKAVSFLRRLVEEQSLKFQRGHSLITQLVAAGEYDLLVDGYAQQATAVQDKSRSHRFHFHESDGREAARCHRHWLKGAASLRGSFAGRLSSRERSPRDDGAETFLLDIAAGR
jgi:hypothetical protein